MSGEDLLKAIGEADERYVQEAEIVTLAKPKFVWVRWAVAAAACFVAVVSAVLLIGPGATEKFSENYASDAVGRYPGGDLHMELQAPVAEMETVAAQTPLETVPEDGLTDQSSVHTPSAEPKDPGVDYTAAEVPSVLLRIDSWQENGFMATVDGIVDTDIFPIGTKLTVTFREGIRIVQRGGELVSCIRRAPTEEDFPAGTVVQVMFQTNGDQMLIVELIGKKDAF